MRNNLYKTVHWRKIRKIFKSIGNYEHINLNNYDLGNIKCYRTQGCNLIARRNVKANTKNGEFPFVLDNWYDIFEAPNINNKSKNSFTGKFLMLAHNTSFDYWILLEMDHLLWGIAEIVSYDVYGSYTISSSNDDLNFIKTEFGRNVTFGGHKASTTMFDYCNDRKRAYKSSNAKVNALHLGYIHRGGSIYGQEIVKKYKNIKKYF